jgi:hypothetical protein
MSNSYEGIGLSVMQCDEEIIESWIHIARLGGTVIELQRRDGEDGQFAVWSQALEDAAIRWGLKQRLITKYMAWEVSWYDEEVDDRRAMVFDSRPEAEAQVEYYEEVEIRPRSAYQSSEALARRWWQHFEGSGVLDTAQASIEVTNMYAAAAFPRLDGIWWNEELDPEALSAPRGVILPHALPRWAAEC